MADPIDTSVLDELEEAVGAEFLVELVETFLAEAPVMMATLFVKSKDWDIILQFGWVTGN